MGCLGECWDIGPPPDSILNLPPPPVPNFLQRPISDLLLNTTPCSATQLCESTVAPNRVPESGDFVELPRKDLESWPSVSIDTSLLVLVVGFIAVLLLGALLAMFLLKCREMNFFKSHHEYTQNHRQMKNHHHEPPPVRDCSTVSSMHGGNNKIVHPTETVLYHGNTTTLTNNDNRMVWAALTPRGTQHFISENYPRDLIDYCEPTNENHYETVDNDVHQQPQQQQYYPYNYDYEDPTPLIESYQLNNMAEQNREYASILGASGGNPDMRCASLGGYSTTSTLSRHSRPKVSSPTRIEHPNLPPLNLYPHNNKSNGGTIKRGSINYRSSIDTLPKYGC